MNKYGFHEDYYTPKEFREFILENYGDWSFLVDTDKDVLISSYGPKHFRMSVNKEIGKDYYDIDEMFNKKIINNKSINDFEYIDFVGL